MKKSLTSVISFNADIKNCTNLTGHKNEEIIRSGDRFEFDPFSNSLLVYRSGSAIWNEYVFFGENGTFEIA